MKSSRQQIFSEINITPLTDIFLVLLIIMMVVAPLLEYRQLDLLMLPPGDTEEPLPDEEKPKTMHVVIDATGRIMVEDVETPMAALVDELRKQAGDFPDGLLVETHPEAPFQAMAQTLDAAQQAQITEISTAKLDISEPEPPPQPAPETKPAKSKKK